MKAKSTGQEQREVESQENVGIDRRDFLTTSALSAAGVVASGMLAAPFAQAGGEKKYNEDAKNTYGQGPYPTEGMAAYSPSGPHKLMKFERRALGPKDVAIKMHYCGVCHSDIHTIRGDWGEIQYPLITGHELAGEVVAVGPSASKFKVGSRVGVGPTVNSCRHCNECVNGFEQYCENGNTQVYGSVDRDGKITQGGYSRFIVVDEDYVIRVPDSIDLAEAGPMMCAGITTYSPLRRWNVGSDRKAAIVGLGGLGHMATQLATAMGAHVTVITTSADKVKDARRFGAKDVIVNETGADLSKYQRAFEFILDTVPYKHDLEPIFPMLKKEGVLCRVGVGKLAEPNEFGQMTLIHRRIATGSITGSIRETQEMVDFCALNKIRPQVQKISLNEIDDAWDKVFNKKARYRYVIDMTKG